MDIRINIESEIFTPEGISTIERKRKAIYVCETCIGQRVKDVNYFLEIDDNPIAEAVSEITVYNWLNWPVAAFYQHDELLVPEGGSQYFGIYHQSDPLGIYPRFPYICNAISAAQTTIVGVIADNGEVIYSRYRHDMRESEDKSVWIDGGRDYTRYNGSATLVDLNIHEGILEISHF